MLTLAEIEVLIPVLDAGIKSAGLQIFQNDGGVKLQSALAKLQAMADEAKLETDKERPNG